jgi:hypothetical protein
MAISVIWIGDGWFLLDGGPTLLECKLPFALVICSVQRN